MPAPQPTRDPTAVEHDRERELLYLLTNLGDSQPLWSPEDLARELEAFDVIDTVNALQRAGLVNRTSDGSVFATRAAVRAVQAFGRNI
jgi:hypothetical protein